jgi:tetratricopeptide (TPR) repeat protein
MTRANPRQTRPHAIRGEFFGRLTALALFISPWACNAEGPGSAVATAPARTLTTPEPAGRSLPFEAEARAAESKPAVAVPANPLADLYEQGKYAEGLEWLRSFGKGGVEEERYAGLFHFGLAHPDASLQHLVPVYRANPADDTIGLAIAEASLWKKDYKTALAIVGQLKAPDAPEALRVRGMVFEHAGRLTEALALYDRAIPQLRQPWGTLERKAQVLSWQKNFDAALASYATVTESPGASIGLRRRCRVRMAEITAWKKNFGGALDQLDALLREDPKLADALLLKGQILEWKGDFSQAKQAYSSILVFDSSNAEARARLDKLLWAR